MARPKTISDADLLGFARTVFRERGPNATTRDVAAAAGISQAALFKRFRSKDELFVAALSLHAPTLHEFVALEAPDDDPRTYLTSAAAWIMQHSRSVMPTILSLASHPRYGRELMMEIHRHNRAGEICAILQLRLRKWQEAGRLGNVPLVPFTHIFMQALTSRAIIEIWSGSEPSPSKPDDLRGFVDVFWDGLRPAEATRPKPSAALPARPRRPPPRGKPRR